MKNRFGQSDLAIPVAFYGKSGIWQELCKPEEIKDYEKYRHPLRNGEEIKDEIIIEEKRDIDTKNFTFIM